MAFVSIHHFGHPSTWLMLLLTVFVLLLLCRKTRTVAVILLSSVLALALFGIFGYRISSLSPQANRTVQVDLPRPADQISQNNVGNSTFRIAAPDVQLENQSAGQSAIQWPEDSQIPPTFSIAPNYSMVPWFKIGLLPILGLLLLGGLAFTFAMLSIPKTRTLGIVLLAAGSILILPIIAGLIWIGSYSPAPTVPFTASQSAWTTQSIQPPQPAIPLPPAYIPQAPMLQPSQSQPDNTPAPNSKQIVQAYQSAIQYYCKAIAQPLKLEKTENLTEKVSTLHINLQDLGHVTISGSSFLINSIGQALAKAMTERMKEGNPQIDITRENSTKVASAEPFQANTAPGKPCRQRTL